MKKYGVRKKEKGIFINNLPEPNKGHTTGNYFIDLHGCWWEVEKKDGSKFWMVGEYPK